MPPGEPRRLRDALDAGPAEAQRYLWGDRSSIRLHDLKQHSALRAPLAELAGRSVLLRTEEQITTAAALIELDGVARRMVLCPADLADEYLAPIAATAESDVVIVDAQTQARVAPTLGRQVEASAALQPVARPAVPLVTTEWVLLTSGTTGIPKMVAHTLASLAGAIKPGSALASPSVWCTYYDIRRYGGLQIFLRAMLGGGSLVLSAAAEPVAALLERAARHGVTHITGTPSHWRRALMTPAARRLAPAYVRMSGEIADQSIIDSLQRFFPNARVAHAFASTEAGVGFEVDDGLAGFPASFLERKGPVEIKVEDGSLHLRSALTASRYLGDMAEALRDADGFVDTGDMLEERAGRYYFVGRKGGIINVGGRKIHPEEIEAVINRHPSVHLALVKARKNPITGAIVVAEVVLKPELAQDAPSEGADMAAGPAADTARIKEEILERCRAELAPYKVPASVRFVEALAVSASGKLARSYA